MSGFGEGLCRAWVRLYTAGLPPDAAERRRDEIDADLWDHAAEARAEGLGSGAMSIEVLGRVLSGLPADLLWRRAIRQRPRLRPEPGGVVAVHRNLELALMVVVAVGIGICITWLPILGSGGASGADVGLGAAVLGGALLLGGGLALRATRPVMSTVMLVVGGLAPSLAWYWLPPVYLVSLAIIVLAIVTARRPVVEPVVT